MKLLQTRRDEDKLILCTDEGTVYLMPVQENIIRCVYTKRDELSNRSLMVMRKRSCLSEPKETAGMRILWKSVNSGSLWAKNPARLSIMGTN